MRAHLAQAWESIRSSYWFIPSLMASLAIVTAFAVPYLDAEIGSEWIEDVGWLHANKPEGARALLSTLAGSFIGVAGVTFSITIASVVYASSQYGPRLLTNFMRDTPNQVTLGTFIATFLYCLLVLRTIRSRDEPIGDGAPGADLLGAFVPNVAILIALVLAVASVGVFIFFIHHIPRSIHVANVVAGIGGELNRQITSHAKRSGSFDEAPAPLPEDFHEASAPVVARGDGYLQHIDEEGLYRIAVDHGVLVRMDRRPGNFVIEGQLLLRVYPGRDVTDELAERLQGMYALGQQRTQGQDPMFLVNELVEIASRALSPGINDPFTANNCLDWLASALCKLAIASGPKVAARRDDDGALRLLSSRVDFEQVVNAVFDQLRPYVSRDRNAALHAFRALAEVAASQRRAEHAAALREQADALATACRESLSHARDRAAIADRHRVVEDMLRDTDSLRAEEERLTWHENTV